MLIVEEVEKTHTGDLHGNVGRLKGRSCRELGVKLSPAACDLAREGTANSKAMKVYQGSCQVSTYPNPNHLQCCQLLQANRQILLAAVLLRLMPGGVQMSAATDTLTTLSP